MPVSTDPFGISDNDMDMESLKKKQENDINIENSLSIKTSDEREKKQERIKKGNEEFKEALK